MATRFMHSILAWQSVRGIAINKEDGLDYLMGSLLPDAVQRRQKRATHFKPYPGCLRWNTKRMEEYLRGSSSWLKMGWTLHLDLDDLWQTICVRPRLFLAPFFILRYPSSISSVYYRELSHYDTLFRNRISEEEMLLFQQDLLRLAEADPEPMKIRREDWQQLISNVQSDLTKESTFNGPWMIGEERFWRFYESAKRRMDCILTMERK